MRDYTNSNIFIPRLTISLRKCGTICMSGFHYEAGEVTSYNLQGRLGEKLLLLKMGLF